MAGVYQAKKGKGFQAEITAYSKAKSQEKLGMFGEL